MNHLQGYTNSKYKLGLTFNGELVSVMTLGKNRFSNGTELIKFASLKNTIVNGGFSRLLSYFKRKTGIINIISYGNRRWASSLNNVYSKFSEEISRTNVNFFYFNQDLILKNRMNFQKHSLKNKLGFNYNEELPTEVNIFLNGYRKIYDCGNLKFKL